MAATKESDSWKRTLTIARDIFAGTCAGINVTLIGQPFDTLKVRLQTQPSNPPLYNGLIDCFKKTIQWEGPTGLYKGVTAPLAGQIFFRANMFLSFAEAKRYLSGYGARQNTIKDFYVAGAWAWFTGGFFECPIDVVKSQLQVQIIRAKTIPNYVAPYESMIGCAKHMIRQNGILALYQGFNAHLIRNIPAGSVHLGTFELLRQYFAKQNNIHPSQLSTFHNLVAGGVGGFLFWFLFFPFDVVKSSLQADNVDKSKRKYNGMIDCYKKLYQEGGISRFYRGFSPCLMRSVPANAIMLWTVAFVTDHLQVR